MLIVLLAAGCGVQDAEMWVVTYGRPAVSPIWEVTENFANAHPAEEEADEPPEEGWSESEESAFSDGVAFLEFLRADDGGLLCIFGGTVLVGEQDGDATTCRWEFWSGQEEVADHESGYHFSYAYRSVVSWTLTLDRRPETLTGGWREDSYEEGDWEESDRWDPDEVGEDRSQMPTLVLAPGDVENASDETDCEAEQCTLSVQEGTRYDLEIEGARYHGDADAGLLYAGQGMGS